MVKSKKELDALQKKILVSEKRLIKDVLGRKLLQYGGVYILWKPDGRNPMLYIGKSDNIHQRIYNHKTNKHATSPSQLNQFVAKTSYPKDLDRYWVQAQKIEDQGDRMQFENYLRGILKPKFNRR